MATEYPLGATTLPIPIAPGASQEQGFQFPNAPGATMILNFVIFGAQPKNSPGVSPLTPSVQVQSQTAAAPYTSIPYETGFWPVAIQGSTKADVEFTAHPSGLDGVYQLIFSPETGGELSNTNWKIQFTNNDANPAQVTFIVDSADTVQPWIGFPLTSATNFAAATTLTPLSDSPTPPFTSQVQLIIGQSYQLSVPIYNYGTAPLSITIASKITTGAFSILPKTTTIPPGGGDVLTVELASQANSVALNSAASPAVLTVPNPDAVHPGSLSFYATVGAMEFVFALDVSGSMASTDNRADQTTRWYHLQGAVTMLMTQLQSFANGGSWGAVLYPDPNDPSGATQSLLIQASKMNPITSSSSLSLNYNPTDSTPMMGGIAAAMGDPTKNPTSDCGQFTPNDSNAQDAAAFQYDHRWLILMTDGVANVPFANNGVTDPSTLPASYYAGRNVKAVTIAFGLPGQTNPGVLQTIAMSSSGVYIGADPSTGDPSAGLVQSFLKAVTVGLALNFPADPTASLPMRAGAVNTHSVIVTTFDKKVTFNLAFIASYQPVLFTLVAPSGEKINEDEAERFGLRFARGPLSITYSLDLASAKSIVNLHGAWTLVVSFFASVASQPGTTALAVEILDLKYAYSAIVDSLLTFHLSTGAAAHYAGAPITIEAALAVQGSPVQDANVRAVITGSGVGFDNWLAGQFLSDADYQAEIAALGAMHDIQSPYVKTLALAKKGVTYPGAPTAATLPLTMNPKTGAYVAQFAATTKPGTYQVLVSAAGQDTSGNAFQRQKSEQIVIEILPSATGTLIDISYQVTSGQMTAIMRFWPRDDYGNVFLIDPAISAAVKVLVSGGATLSGGLMDNRDGSYTQRFIYPVTASPVISINVGGQPVIPKLPVPDFSKLDFVTYVVAYTQGREASSGANKHTQPNQALGDPSKKPASEFVALGGRGAVEFRTQTYPIHPLSVSVFVTLDTSLRPYAVQVLPGGAGAEWIEVGRSKGVSQTFSLVPTKIVLPSPKDWYIEVEGRIAGETFDVKIPLAGKLHPPKDPLQPLVKAGVEAIRIVDLSNIVTNPDGTPSATPGVSVAAVGFKL
jgi:hypothetical protein